MMSMKPLLAAGCALAFMLEANAAATLFPLQSEYFNSLEVGDGSYQLTQNHYAPDGKGRIVVNAVTHRCYQNEGYRKDAEAVSGAAVEDLCGQYMFRVDQAGAHDIWARVKAPWPGHWSFTLSATRPGSVDKKGGDGLPEGFQTKIGDGAGNTLEGGLAVTKGQVGKYSYVKAGRLNLEPGGYVLELRVPGKIRVDQLLLTPRPVEKPESEFAGADGKPLPGRPVKARRGELVFQKAFPIDLKSHVRVVPADGKGVSWFYRFPDAGQAVWTPTSGDLSGLPAAGIQLKLVLEAKDGEPSPQVSTPALAYIADAVDRIVLKTASGKLSVSSRSGYWGGIQGAVQIRPDSMAELPFYLGVIKKGALTELKDFHATEVKFNDGCDSWNLDADYVNTAGDINVHLRADWEGGDAITWRAEIENKSPDTVDSFSFPVLSGVQIGDSAADDGIAWLGSLRNPMSGLEGWLRSGPGQLGYFDVFDSKAALYLGDHDPSMLDAEFHLRPYTNAPPYSYRLEKRPTILPGDKWRSGKYVLAVHGGDWHQAADNFYRPWYDAEMPKPSNPRWLVEDFSGFAQMVGLNQTPERMTESWRIARFHGWNYLKTFNTEWPGPEFFAPKGGFDTVRRNARWIDAHGGQADSYTDCAYCVRYHCKEFPLRMTIPALLYNDLPQLTLDWLLEHGVIPLEDFGKTPKIKADPDRVLWPQQPFDYHMDLADKAAHDYWERIAVHYAKAGMNLYWDESGNPRTLPSYKPLDKHVRPGYNWSLYGKAECARRMITAARELKPDFVMVGENYNDKVMSAVNIPYHQDTGDNSQWDEVVPFTHPDHIFNVSAIKQPMMPAQVARAFLFHARISSCDIFNGPAFTSWLRARVLLQEAVKDVARLGKYRDNVGLTVSGKGVDARYALLDGGGRFLISLNAVNPAAVQDGTLSLALPGLPVVKSAFVYTMEGKVRAHAFTQLDDKLSLKIPPEPLSTTLLCAEEEERRGLRVFAMMPLFETAPAKARLALANLTERPVGGCVHFDAAAPLRPMAQDIPFTLEPGGAKTIDVPFTGRDRLADFVDWTGVVRGDCGDVKFSFNVAPTVPNGDFELDAADNSIADFWQPGLRDFAEPFSGKYCLVMPPKQRQGRTHGGSSSFWNENDPCPFHYAQSFVYLLPETNYTLSCQYRGSAPLGATVTGFDERNRSVFSKTFALERRWPFAWNAAKLDFTTPAGVYKCYLSFSNRSQGEAAANGWIDAVELRENSSGPQAP